jgi:hypothetical protein
MFVTASQYVCLKIVCAEVFHFWPKVKIYITSLNTQDVIRGRMVYVSHIVNSKPKVASGMTFHTKYFA